MDVILNVPYAKQKEFNDAFDAWREKFHRSLRKLDSFRLLMRLLLRKATLA
jgi:hypothetical protein